jgi:hypothetical protein
VKALGLRGALRPVRQELGAPLDGHAARVAAVGTGRLDHHAHAGIAAQVADLLGVGDADHGERRGVVQEPHRHRQRRAVRLHGGQQGDGPGGEEPLDRAFAEHHHVAFTLRLLFNTPASAGASGRIVAQTSERRRP